VRNVALNIRTSACRPHTCSGARVGSHTPRFNAGGLEGLEDFDSGA
jgi:hypothetical protein